MALGALGMLHEPPCSSQTQQMTPLEDEEKDPLALEEEEEEGSYYMDQGGNRKEEDKEEDRQQEQEGATRCPTPAPERARPAAVGSPEVNTSKWFTSPASYDESPPKRKSNPAHTEPLPVPASSPPAPGQRAPYASHASSKGQPKDGLDILPSRVIKAQLEEYGIPYLDLPPEKPALVARLRKYLIATGELEVEREAPLETVAAAATPSPPSHQHRAKATLRSKKALFEDSPDNHLRRGAAEAARAAPWAGKASAPVKKAPMPPPPAKSLFEEDVDVSFEALCRGQTRLANPMKAGQASSLGDLFEDHFEEVFQSGSCSLASMKGANGTTSIDAAGRIVAPAGLFD